MTKDETLTRLKKEFDENKNSHIFLVETDNTEKCIKDIKSLIKHIIKADNVISHQIDEEFYLELLVVRSNGKDIKKDQIKELQDRIKTKPKLSKYMTYIIEHSETMNDSASNKLLKTIEEPNKDIIGFMITENIDIMLPTIKSRCEIVSLLYKETADEEIDKEIVKLAEKLITAIENGDHIMFYRTKTDNKILKDNHKLVENLIKDYYNTACNLRSAHKASAKITEMIQKKNSYRSLIKKAKYLNTTLNKLSNNMNGDLLLEKIFLDIKGVK